MGILVLQYVVVFGLVRNCCWGLFLRDGVQWQRLRVVLRLFHILPTLWVEGVVHRARGSDLSPVEVCHEWSRGEDFWSSWFLIVFNAYPGDDCVLIIDSFLSCKLSVSPTCLSLCVRRRHACVFPFNRVAYSRLLHLRFQGCWRLRSAAGLTSLEYIYSNILLIIQILYCRLYISLQTVSHIK